MDNAATALEAGAARVDMVIRRDTLPAVNKFTGIAAWAWCRVLSACQMRGNGASWIRCSMPRPAAKAKLLRVFQPSQSFFHLSCPIDRLEMADNAVPFIPRAGEMETDFIIAATVSVPTCPGGPNSPLLRPISGCGKTASRPPRRTCPRPCQRGTAASPDLGPGFEFLEKVPGSCPWLKYVHCFCFPATLSHGKVSGDIPAISDGPSVLRAISPAPCSWRTARPITQASWRLNRPNKGVMNGMTTRSLR
ncbi:hypothetical protein [Komagataeibacter nataicola]|uniref:hypothetical protein n=1 Tax=Komagataeibacter nataicola TaxID=265960 RepID=UPI00197C8D52|nr:hypothetical protein [Komagataeibacter nataicola]